jgi:ribonuclease P protein component
VNRKFRLTRSTEIQRVRRLGQSRAHPLVVLICHPNQINKVRLGIIASRSVGNAVQRNRSKRRIREVVRPIIPTIQAGWDIILLARKPVVSAHNPEICLAINNLLIRSELLKEPNVR